MPSRSTDQKALAFREAIAQWQLAARTAVKQSSSLPTQVFDTCDPMLEAQLASTVQQLMDQLQKPTGFDRSDTPERRRENVEPGELAQLRRRVGEGSAQVELYSGQMAELLGVLLDMVATAPGSGRDAALAVLREQFGIDGQTDLGDAARTLAEIVCQADAASGSPQLDPELEQRVAALCSQIAAAALLQTRRQSASPAPPARPEAST